MFSYIVAVVAALLFLSDPISRFLSPDGGGSRRSSSLGPLSPRPRLNEDLLAIDAPNATTPQCPEDSYVAHDKPSYPIFEPALIGSQDQERDASIRDSHVALLPRTDTVRCIERRAMAVQGWRRDAWIERLRTQRYDAPSGHYAHHYDWNVHRGGWGRVSSFMVWVDDQTPGQQAGVELEGGGTEFPLLPRRWEGDRWCRFVECPPPLPADDGTGAGNGTAVGTTFKVVPGNAVYWENFTPDGRGFEETWHAGLPVTRGTKVGLNIWTFGRIE
ncbi:prolyl 4-hydroxylase [Geosmithia morbida]|uniref:Prolyl 4-hydroxylase n=1 Tax=Geosmithia morbida TaxID=1094350 RepID=A0A9P4YUA2_9HYPO|nr:prolyl 4-hydroxylase [Geosmithia morbida]KAF4123216.1 prolyl 4-hydroxylase [Geosmithia morbida]